MKKKPPPPPDPPFVSLQDELRLTNHHILELRFSYEGEPSQNHYVRCVDLSQIRRR